MLPSRTTEIRHARRSQPVPYQGIAKFSLYVFFVTFKAVEHLLVDIVVAPVDINLNPGLSLQCKRWRESDTRKAGGKPAPTPRSRLGAVGELMLFAYGVDYGLEKRVEAFA